MKDLKYIFADNIYVDKVGTLYPLTISEYNKLLNLELTGVFQITVKLYLQSIDMDKKDLRESIEKHMKNFDIINKDKIYMEKLIKLLSMCFRIDENKIYTITEGGITVISLNWDKDKYDEFLSLSKAPFESNNERLEELSKSLFSKIIHRDNYDFVMQEIIKINNIRLPKQSKNPELQKIYDKDYMSKYKSKENDTDLEDIVTAIVAETGILFREVKDMTIYQANKLIERIGLSKEFENGIQFVCAGAEKVDLKSWLTHSSLDTHEVETGSSFDTFYKEMEGFISTEK